LISGGAGTSGAKSSRSSGSMATASSSSVKISSCSQSSPKTIKHVPEVGIARKTKLPSTVYQKKTPDVKLSIHEVHC
jgi:hypothetical protein